MSNGIPNGDLKLVRLIYSDEAGIGDETIEPITVVAATVIHADQQWPLINNAIEKIVEELVPENRRVTFEFKASALFAQLGKGNNDLILRRFLSIFTEFNLPIAVGAFDRAAVRQFLKPENRSAIIYQATQNSAFLVCATHVETVFRMFFPHERGLWIADETRAKLPMKITLHDYQKMAAFPNIPSTHFEHIIDMAYFGDSKDSRGIQLADACNFFVKKHLMKNPSAERFYDIIKTQIISGEPQIHPLGGEVLRPKG